jgi:hypothetical protein
MLKENAVVMSAKQLAQKRRLALIVWFIIQLVWLRDYGKAENWMWKLNKVHLIAKIFNRQRNNFK